MKKWKKYLTDNMPGYLEELADFLRIPSISSLPEHAGDVRRAAQWVARRLEKAGAEQVQVLPTADNGHPVVVGRWLHAAGAPTVLIYGHFDVQPVDPLALWSTPPFEPRLENGRIYARGAADDKGNMLAPILAFEALLKTTGALPVNVKFFFEGQEEIGSPQLSEFIAARRNLLACDLVLSADGGQWDEEHPCLIVGRRGLCAMQIDVQAAGHDVHSGTYGGTFRNPLQALAVLIAGMHDSRGCVRVKGFYDDVRPLSAAERDRIAEIPFDEAAYTRGLGVDKLFGEPGYSTYERAWTRPTLEVNGLWGGFQGEGIKTVIPSTAHAKLTCRLVPDQKPDKILELIRAHVEHNVPEGVTAAFNPLGGGADPFLIAADHPGNRVAGAVLKELYGKEPYIARMGGTIPVSGMFLEHLGTPMVNFAFGLQDENVHAPNEFFRIASFERGLQAYALILERLGAGLAPSA